MPTKEQIDQYWEQGYFVADDAVEPRMLDELEAATRRVRDKTRADEVDLRSNRGEGREPLVIWALFAPEFGEPAFAEYMLSKPIESYVHSFIGDQLRLGFQIVFCTGNYAPYDTGWHRDFGPHEVQDGTEEEEMEILNRPITRLKWHLALVDDPCLWVVPGSQRRYRTDAERECLHNARQDSIAGEKQIEVKRGQTLFWSGNLIHRGRVPEGVEERLTLAAGLTKHHDTEPIRDPYPTDVDEVDERYRWRMANNIRETLPGNMKLYYDRWRALQQGSSEIDAINEAVRKLGYTRWQEQKKD